MYSNITEGDHELILISHIAMTIHNRNIHTPIKSLSVKGLGMRQMG